MTEWFRWWHNSASDPKFRLVGRKAGQPVAIVVAVWATLLEFASANEDRGSLERLDQELVAEILGIEESAITAVIEGLRDKGMISVDNRIAAWERRQPQREDNSIERVRRFRESQRAERYESDSNAAKHTVTHGNADVTRCNASEKSREDKSREDTEQSSGSRYRATGTAPPATAAPPPPPAQEQKSKPKPKQTGNRLPEDFTVPTEWLEWGSNERPDLDIRATAEKFVDHYHAANGVKAASRDWLATWRNWVRNEYHSKRKNGQPHKGGKTEKFDDKDYGERTPLAEITWLKQGGTQ